MSEIYDPKNENGTYGTNSILFKGSSRGPSTGELINTLHALYDSEGTYQNEAARKGVPDPDLDSAQSIRRRTSDIEGQTPLDMVFER